MKNATTPLAFVLLSLSLSLPMSSAHAQSPQGSANPFADPMRALGAALPPSLPVMPPSPPPMPPPPPVVGSGIDAGREFDKLGVMYVIGNEAMLRVAPAAPGGPAGRPYVVRHNVRARVLGKWVMPDVSGGRVSLFADGHSVEVNPKLKKQEMIDLLWTGYVELDDGLLPNAQGAQAPQSIGVAPNSPSQRGAGGGGGGSMGTAPVPGR